MVQDSPGFVFGRREGGEKLFNYLTPSPIFKNGLDEGILLWGGCRIGISRDEITLRLNGEAIFSDIYERIFPGMISSAEWQEVRSWFYM